VDDSTRSQYEVAGMSYFQPWPDKPAHVMRTYYEVPAHIQRRPEELCQWAGEALDNARRHKKPQRKKSLRKKSQPKPANTNVSSKKLVPTKSNKLTDSGLKTAQSLVQKLPVRPAQKKSGSR